MDNSFGSRLRRGIASLSVAAIMAGALQIGVVAAATFSDVKEGDWFYSYVEQLVEDGVVDAGDKYRPGDNVNRAEFTKMVVEAAGLDMETTAPGFSDVKSSDWFYGYVATAKANGVVDGYSDGTFKPGASINRAEAMKMVVNAFGLTENTAGGPHFADVAGSAWYYNFVETGYNWSVVDGMPDGTFGPGANMNRAQIAKVVVNAGNPVERAPEGPGPGPDEPPVASGALEVAIASSSAAPMSLPEGSAYNKLVTFEFTASNEDDVQIKGLTVTRGGYSGNTCISGVSIWDSMGDRHGNIVQSVTSEGKATVTFANNPIMVEAGSSSLVTIGINVLNSSTCNSGTMNIGLSAATDVDSTAEAVEGTFPVLGATHALVSGDSSLAAVSVTDPLLSVGGGASASETQVDTGAVKEFMKVKFNEDGNFEDGVLTDMYIFIDGTVSSGDLVDFTLKAQDGALLAEAPAMDSQKYVHFKLATPYLIPKGTSRFVSVSAKVADTSNNANRTFMFTVKNDYDVLIKGATTGAYILVSLSSGLTFPEPDTSESYWFKIKEGTLTASKSSDSPSGFVPVGADDVVLASFDLKAAGEDMELQKLGINVLEAASNEIDAEGEALRGTIRFKVNGQTVYSVTASTYTSAIYVDAADDLTSLSTYYVIKAGTTAKLTVEGSIKTDVGGQAYLVELDDVYARRVSSNNYTTLTPGIGANSLTVEASALAVSANGAFAPAIVVEGSSGVQVGSYKFQAGNAEDLNVTSIKVKVVDATPAITGINNVSLKSNGVPLGDTVSNPNVAGDTISTSGFKVPKNTTVLVDVYADVTSAANEASTLQSTITAAGVNFVGMTSNASSTSPTAAVSSPTTPMNIETSGSLTLGADATGTPIQQIVHALQTDVEMLRFKVSVTNAEPITLDKLYFSVTNGEGNVTSVKLLDSTGAPLGEASSVNNGQVKFTGLNKLYSAGDIKTVMVKASVTDSGVLTQSAKVVIAPVYMEFTGKNSGTKTISSGGVFTSYLNAGDLITVYDIAQFEALDAVYIDANGDGDMLDTSVDGMNETAVQYICDRDATNAQFTLDTNSDCSGASTVISGDSTTDGRISPVTFNSKTMILQDVEPTISRHPNSLSGTAGGQLAQEVASYNIMADGERDLTFSALRVKVTGSYTSSATYASSYSPMGLELWRGDSSGSAATQIGNIGATSGSYSRLISGTIENSDDQTLTMSSSTGGATIENGANDAAVAENGVINLVDATEASKINVGDIISFASVISGSRCVIAENDGATPPTITVTTGTDCTGSADTDVDSAPDAGTITTVYHALETTDKISSGGVVEFVLGSSTETITQGTTGNYVVKVDTSGLKNPAVQGTSTLTLRINGSKGGTALQAAGSTPAIGDSNGGLTWSYSNKNSAASGSLVISDSYPIDSNTILY